MVIWSGNFLSRSHEWLLAWHATSEFAADITEKVEAFSVGVPSANDGQDGCARAWRYYKGNHMVFSGRFLVLVTAYSVDYVNIKSRIECFMGLLQFRLELKLCMVLCA